MDNSVFVYLLVFSGLLFLGWLSVTDRPVERPGDAPVGAGGEAVNASGGEGSPERPAEDRVPDNRSEPDSSPKDEESVNKTVSEGGVSSGGGVADLSVLFIGNSFTSSNGLPEIYGSLVEREVEVQSITDGGKRLHGHYRDYRSGGRTRSLVEQDWDFVVMQEQSQVPGFANDNPEKKRSLEGARGIANHTKHANRTILMMTWGYRNGDERNDFIYPNYTRMQKHLERGYLELRNHARQANRDVTVAPVGTAYRHIYWASNSEPENNRFHDLYSSDGKHPGLEGTYVAALTLKAETTGLETQSTPPDGITEDKAEFYRKHVERAVEQWHSKY